MGRLIGTHPFNKEAAQCIAHDIESKDAPVPQLPGLVSPQEEKADQDIPHELVQEGRVHRGHDLPRGVSGNGSIAAIFIDAVIDV